MAFKIFILLFLPLYFFPQTVGKSQYEKAWALAHPIAALKVKKIYTKATPEFRLPKVKQQTDTFGNGGKLDAFRHTFYMAAFAQKVKVKKLRELGQAHEKANHQQFLRRKNEDGEVPDSLGSVMDLANNEVGFLIGSTNKKADLKTLRELVIKAIKSGDCKIMNRTKKGVYLDCNNKEIDLKNFVGKWDVPKCLVSSATTYID